MRFLWGWNRRRSTAWQELNRSTYQPPPHMGWEDQLRGVGQKPDAPQHTQVPADGEEPPETKSPSTSPLLFSTWLLNEPERVCGEEEERNQERRSGGRWKQVESPSCLVWCCSGVRGASGKGSLSEGIPAGQERPFLKCGCSERSCMKSWHNGDTWTLVNAVCWAGRLFTAQATSMICAGQVLFQSSQSSGIQLVLNTHHPLAKGRQLLDVLTVRNAVVF